MIEKYTGKIALQLAQAKNYEQGCKEYQYMKYGLDAVFLFVEKTTVLLIASYFWGMLYEMLFYLGLLLALKTFSLGVHLQNNTICSVVGYLYFFAGVLLARWIPNNIIISGFIVSICFILNLKYAPSPTEKKPFRPGNKMKFKIISLVIIAVYFLLAIVIPHETYKNLTVIVVVLETFGILPITYHLLNERRLTL